MTEFKFRTDRLVYKNNMWVSKTQLKVSYPEESSELCCDIEENSFWFNHRNDCICSLIKNFHPNGNFVDIGGGNGYVSLAIQKSGLKTLLIEPSKLGVLAAQKRGIKNIINSTFDEVGFKKKSIDAVGLFDVLEHIKDDLSLLQAINCPLKKGGFLFLTVPSYNWLWSHEDVYAGHYRRYRLTKLKNLLLAAGFKIRYSSYFFSFLPPFIFIKRRLPFLLFGSQPVSAQTINRDHAGNHSNSWLLTRLLDAELKFVNNLNSIPIGSSCIVVAQKL